MVTPTKAGVSMHTASPERSEDEEVAPEEDWVLTTTTSSLSSAVRAN